MNGPRLKKQAEGLAEKINSLTAQFSGGGAAMPPISSARPRRHHSASLIACTVLTNSGETLMECVAGSNTGGLWSAAAKDSAIGPSANRAASDKIVRTVSASRSA